MSCACVENGNEQAGVTSVGISYPTWLDCVFAQPHSSEPHAWSPDVGDATPAEIVSFMTRLFASCGNKLAPFDDRQVAQGLWYVVSPGNSDCMFDLYDRGVGWDERCASIRSMFALYRDCFAHRCEDAETNEVSPGNRINGVCFMWWDVFPSGGSEDTTDQERASVDRELIGVMAHALELRHLACRESALHGLGHWETADPERVHGIIDGWLARNPDLPSTLQEYARAAREGQVQ